MELMQDRSASSASLRDLSVNELVGFLNIGDQFANSLIIDLAQELIELCKTKKHSDLQHTRSVELLKGLRELGFTSVELCAITGGYWAEPTIRKYTRGVVALDTVEHDKALGVFSDFASKGYALEDYEEYKKAKALLDSNDLSFETVVLFGTNLQKIDSTIGELDKLSKEIANQPLTVPEIKRDFDLNTELGKKGFTKEVLVEIRGAAAKYGAPATVLQALNAYGTLGRLQSELNETEKMCTDALTELKRINAEKEGVVAETLTIKTWVDIVKMLMLDYHFDKSSFRTLYELAKKHGNPLEVMSAVNDYGSLKAIEDKLAEDNVTKKNLEGEISERNVTLRDLDEKIASRNQIIGEIRAKHEASSRLQDVSSLIMNPKGVRSSPEELSRTVMLILSGLKEYQRIHPEDSAKMKTSLGQSIDWLINALQRYLDG